MDCQTQSLNQPSEGPTQLHMDTLKNHKPVYWVTGTKIKRLIKSPLPPGPVSSVEQTQVDIWRQDPSANERRGHKCLCLISEAPESSSMGPAWPLTQISHRWWRQRRAPALSHQLDSCVQGSVSVPSRDRPRRVERTPRPGETGRKGRSRRKARRAGCSWSDSAVSSEPGHP